MSFLLSMCNVISLEASLLHPSEPYKSSGADAVSQTFTFMRGAANDSVVDLSDLVDKPGIQLRKETPQELIVNMFQKMVSPHNICLCERSNVTV